jgi:ABC-type amino acid transport system permease subunit
MRSWPVPPEIEDAHEKFLGPLGFRQFLYAVGGFVLGCFLAALPLPVWLRVIGFVAGVCAGAVLALAKFYGIPCDVFLLRLWKWWRSPREYPLRREG